MLKERKVISRDNVLAMVCGATPHQQKKALDTGLRAMMAHSSKAMSAMYATVRCKEFIDKFVSTPNGDALSALVQVIDQEGPSRSLGPIALSQRTLSPSVK